MERVRVTMSLRRTKPEVTCEHLRKSPEAYCVDSEPVLVQNTQLRCGSSENMNS